MSWRLSVIVGLMVAYGSMGPQVIPSSAELMASGVAGIADRPAATPPELPLLPSASFEQFAGIYQYTTDPPSGTGLMRLYQDGESIWGYIEVFSDTRMCGVAPLSGFATRVGCELTVDLAATTCDCLGYSYMGLAYEDPDTRDTLIGWFNNTCGGGGGITAVLIPTASNPASWGTLKHLYQN